MMHKPLMLLLMLFWSTAVTAQSTGGNTINQFKRQLDDSKSDSGKVNRLLALSHAYNTLPDEHALFKDSALLYARKAEQLSTLYAFKKGEGLSYQETARYFSYHHDYKQGKAYIDRAVALFKQNKLIREEAEAWLLEEEFYVASGGQDVNVRINYYQKARSLFSQAGAVEREAATLKILGDFLQVRGDYVQSLAVLKQSLVLYQHTQFKALQGLYDLIAYVSTILGDHETGLKYGLAALRTAEAVHDTTLQLCTIYNRIALTYSRLTQYPQSELYYHYALGIAVKYKDTLTIIQVMLNDADALLRIHQPAHALHMVKTYWAKYPTHDKDYQLLNLTTLVAIYIDLKKIDSAGVFCRKMLSVMDSPPATDPNTEVGVRLAAIKYFMAARQFQQARKYLQDYTNRSNELHLAIGTLTSYKYKYKIDSLEGKYLDALNDFRLYTRLKDSVFNIKKSKQIEELKISYETDQKEKDIHLLKNDSLLQHEKVRRANMIRNLTASGLIVLLVMISLLYYSYCVNRRNATRISKTNAILEELVAEKEWLIKEIHHRVKNNLQIVMGLLQRQSAYIDNEAALQAIQNSESRMHSIALIHQKLYQSESLNLISMPQYVDELTCYIKDWIDTDNNIRFEKNIDEIALDVAQAVPLGLILNEAITNAVKYAYKPDECGVIYVMLKQHADEQIELTIADEGKGLQPEFDVKTINSLGMNLMKGLSKQIGGLFELSHQKGVKIKVTFKIERFSRPAHHNANT